MDVHVIKSRNDEQVFDEDVAEDLKDDEEEKEIREELVKALSGNRHHPSYSVRYIQSVRTAS